MGPTDDGSDNDRDSGIRRTDGWRQDVPLQEIAARLDTTTDPLLIAMGELGLRYDQGQFYQRQESGEGAARREIEISAEAVLALLQPRFTGSGAADESGDPTIPIDDDAIESAESVPLRGPPSALPSRRERPAEPEEPSVRVSETYVGQMDQRARLNKRLNKLEGLHLALSGNNPEELIREALTDYLTLVPTNEKPDEGDITNFFDAVKARGREIVSHYTSQLELLLEQAPEAAGHFAVEAASNLYFDLSMANVEKFVNEGLQAADKVGYFSIQGDVGKRAFENLFIDEHERLVRGEAALKEKADRHWKQSLQNAAEARRYRDALQPVAQSARGWRKGFFILSAGMAALALWAGYVHLDRNVYRERHEALQQQQTELREQHTNLNESYGQLLQRAKAIQEGPQGQAWKKREEEYSALERVQKAWEKEAMESRDLVRSWRQTPAARISENIHDSQELSRITAEYVGKLGYIRIPGPGCERGLKNLHTALGGSKETEKGFVSALQSKGVCQGMAEDEPYLEFFKK